MEVIAVHNAPYDHKESIKTQCCEILNDEWPRSETLRRRSLNSSTDDLPMCLALVQWFYNGKEACPCVLGHARLARITAKAEAVWIESVVLHPDLRGKGIGKYLMLIIEEFAKNKGFSEAYLCTIDRQIFYSRCGYSFCEPVCAYSGNIKLPSGLTSAKPKLAFEESNITQLKNNGANSNSTDIKTSRDNQNKSVLFSEKESATSGESKQKSKDNEGGHKRTTSSCSVIPNRETNNDEVTDISVLCAKMYCRPSLSSNVPDPLKSPLRSLTKNNNGIINKLSKNEICRAIIPKDYMKKKL